MTLEDRQAVLDYIAAHRTCPTWEACEAALGDRDKRKFIKWLRRNDPWFEEDYRTARGYGEQQVMTSIVEVAIEGVEEPLVSAGKVVTDEDGKPLTVRKRSDRLLEMLYKTSTDEGRVLVPGKLEISGDLNVNAVQKGVSMSDVALLLQQVGALPALEEAPAGEIVAEEDEPVE